MSHPELNGTEKGEIFTDPDKYIIEQFEKIDRCREDRYEYACSGEHTEKEWKKYMDVYDFKIREAWANVEDAITVKRGYNPYLLLFKYVPSQRCATIGSVNIGKYMDKEVNNNYFGVMEWK